MRKLIEIRKIKWYENAPMEDDKDVVTSWKFSRSKFRVFKCIHFIDEKKTAPVKNSAQKSKVCTQFERNASEKQTTEIYSHRKKDWSKIKLINSRQLILRQLHQMLKKNSLLVLVHNVFLPTTETLLIASKPNERASPSRHTHTHTPAHARFPIVRVSCRCDYVSWNEPYLKSLERREC